MVSFPLCIHAHAVPKSIGRLDVQSKSSRAAHRRRGGADRSAAFGYQEDIAIRANEMRPLIDVVLPSINEPL